MQGRVKVLEPSINLATVLDGRGVIMSFVPKDAIKEFVYQVTHAGKSRGYHYHPEFDEYILYTDGEGVYVERLEDGTDRHIPISADMCLYIPLGVYHTAYSVTTIKSVSLLTKPWDDCVHPILKGN